jgi:hypothetical protein
MYKGYSNRKLTSLLEMGNHMKYYNIAFKGEQITTEPSASDDHVSFLSMSITRQAVGPGMGQQLAEAQRKGGLFRTIRSSLSTGYNYLTGAND